MSDRLYVGIVLGLLAGFLYHLIAVPRGAPAWPIVISYDRTGEAVDRKGVPFNFTNPGR